MTSETIPKSGPAFGGPRPKPRAVGGRRGTTARGSSSSAPRGDEDDGFTIPPDDGSGDDGGADDRGLNITVQRGYRTHPEAWSDDNGVPHKKWRQKTELWAAGELENGVSRSTLAMDIVRL